MPGRLQTSAPQPQPLAVEEHLGPAGQVDAVVAPLDALGAARRDDLGVARRAAERRRRDSAAHDPVPDDVVGPTPRSQIRIRTRVGRFDVRELDVRSAPGNIACRSSAGAEPREPLVVGQRAEQRRTAGCRNS